MGRFFAPLCMAVAFVAYSAMASGSSAAELVMFERAGCTYCMRWNDEIAPAYKGSEEARVAPLRRYDLAKGQPTDVKLNLPVRYTPTFVLVDNGKEVGRITGYFDNAMFWGLLEKLLGKIPAVHKKV